MQRARSCRIVCQFCFVTHWIGGACRACLEDSVDAVAIPSSATEAGYWGHMAIVFIGDIHQMWDKVERGLARLEILPKAAVILGDVQCDNHWMLWRPLCLRVGSRCTGSSATMTMMAGRGCGTS